MNDEREFLRGNTPILILAVLAGGPHHGYAIAREVNRLSGDALRLRQGALYPALHALERDGMVEGAWEGTGERERKVYTLTEAGKQELERRTRIWSRLSGALNAVLKENLGDQPA